MIQEHCKSWLGYPVKDFVPMAPPPPPPKPAGFLQKLGLTKPAAPPPTPSSMDDAANTIYRLGLGWDSKMEFPELLAAFLDAHPSVHETPGLIIGAWMGSAMEGDSEPVVKLLAGASSKLPAVKGIFVGDMVSEECEVSWINQSSMAPLLTAYPRLEHLRVRGTPRLSFAGVAGHPHLKSLVIETGGMPHEVLKELLALNLPSLEHLELWLGTPDYDGNCTAADLAPLFSGGLFPKLRRLGLRNAQIADDVAAAIAKAPLLDRLSELDLSLGTLSDAGAQHLLTSPGLQRLKSLDLHHHYCSSDMMAELERAFPGVNLADQEEADGDDRYVSVGE